MMFNKVVTILVAFICGVSAQIQFPGACPNIGVTPVFDLSSYLGQWYEIEKYTTVFEAGGICNTARYTILPNSTVEVYNTQINGLTGEFLDITGNARLANASSTEAKLLVDFPSVNSYDAPYNVLDTDYTSYSIVWSCRNSGSNNLQSLWFLSRNRNPEDRLRGYVRGYLNAIRLNTDLLTASIQTNCVI